MTPICSLSRSCQPFAKKDATTRSAADMMSAMSNTDWRARLIEAIERDGRSDRVICAAIGRSGSYLNGILRGGKEPGIESMVRLAETLNISLSWLMFGIELDGDAEKLLRLFTSLSATRRKSFLQMAEAVVSAADEKR